MSLSLLSPESLAYLQESISSLNNSNPSSAPFLWFQRLLHSLPKLLISFPAKWSLLHKILFPSYSERFPVFSSALLEVLLSLAST